MRPFKTGELFLLGEDSTRVQDPRAHRPAVYDPRSYLLRAMLRFVRAAQECADVERIALLGSLTTAKKMPKDADILVVVGDDIDLAPLARVSRQLQGRAQSANLGADIFLADRRGQYVGRVCSWRECRPRQACLALNCGVRMHLNDDLHVVTLAPELVRDPPVELWPKIIRRIELPPDLEELLLAPLEKAGPNHSARKAQIRSISTPS